MIEPQTLEGATVFDPKGERIGTVYDVFIDEQTHRPEWLAVDAGMSHFDPDRLIPIVHAEVTESGIKVPFSKEQVDDAPRIHWKDRLFKDDELRLYDHYGISYGTDVSSTLLAEDPTAGRIIGSDSDRGGHAATTLGPDDIDDSARPYRVVLFSQVMARVRSRERRAA